MLHGRTVELDVLRHTPGGVPMLKFRFAHESVQDEAGTPRKIGCEIAAVAFDREARLLSGTALGAEMTITGFIDSKARSGRQLVLHATHIAFESKE